MYVCTARYPFIDVPRHSFIACFLQRSMPRSFFISAVMAIFLVVAALYHHVADAKSNSPSNVVCSCTKPSFMLNTTCKAGTYHDKDSCCKAKLTSRGCTKWPLPAWKTNTRKPAKDNGKNNNAILGASKDPPKKCTPSDGCSTAICCSPECDTAFCSKYGCLKAYCGQINHDQNNYGCASTDLDFCT